MINDALPRTRAKRLTLLCRHVQQACQRTGQRRIVTGWHHFAAAIQNPG